jgi:hypothetical protein
LSLGGIAGSLHCHREYGDHEKRNNRAHQSILRVKRILSRTN